MQYTTYIEDKYKIQQLLEKLEPLIKATASRYKRSDCEYPDLCQECRLAIILALRKYDPERKIPLLYYLKKMVNYHMLNYCRKDYTTISLDQPAYNNDSSATYYDILHSQQFSYTLHVDTSLWIRQLLDTLTPKQRNIIIQYFFYDKSLKDIAKQQNMHYQSVVKLKDRAIAKMKKNVSSYFK